MRFSIGTNNFGECTESLPVECPERGFAPKSILTEYAGLPVNEFRLSMAFEAEGLLPPRILDSFWKRIRSDYPLVNGQPTHGSDDVRRLEAHSLLWLKVGMTFPLRRLHKTKSSLRLLGILMNLFSPNTMTRELHVWY